MTTERRNRVRQLSNELRAIEIWEEHWNEDGECSRIARQLRREQLLREFSVTSDKALQSPSDDVQGAAVEPVTEERRQKREKTMSAPKNKHEAPSLVPCRLAHDLNNSLSAILGRCQLLGDSLEPDSPAARNLESIREVAATMADRIAACQRLPVWRVGSRQKEASEAANLFGSMASCCLTTHDERRGEIP